MKKILAAALVMSLSGTAFAAAPAEKLPAHIQELMKQLKSGKLKDVPPYPQGLKEFLETSQPQIQKYQTQLTGLLNKKGYLIGSAVAILAQQTLTEAKNNIKSLIPVERGPGQIASARGGVPYLIDYLETAQVPSGFPFQCYNYAGKRLTGFVTTMNGKLTFHHSPYKSNDYVGFLTDIHDVGLIQSGKEYIVSMTSKLQYAWLGPDKTTGKQVVVCMGHPHTSSAKEPGRSPNPTEKRGGHHNPVGKHTKPAR